jgi:hypothetical protein
MVDVLVHFNWNDGVASYYPVKTRTNGMPHTGSLITTTAGAARTSSDNVW